MTDQPTPTAAAGTGQPAGLPDIGYDPAVLDALLGPALQPGPSPRPVDWAGLDAAAAASAWAALDAWVRWLARRYGIDHRELPPCWYAHGDLLEELSALHTAHQGAYHPAGPGTGPADWHHQLAATRTRLHASVARAGCRPGEHRPPTVPGWAADPAPPDYTAGLASHIATDLATRH